jgi:hypothetical protein
MKLLTRTAALFVGALMASQAAHAQSTVVANDLYLGFENTAGNGSTADYIINLGSGNALVGSSTVVNLSSDFSLVSFDSTALQGTNSSGVILGGVVGGSNAGNPSDLFLTDAVQPGALTRSQDNGAYSAFTQVNGPAAGAGVLDSGKTWEAYVAPTLSTGSVYGETGINPDAMVGTSTVFDLWETSSSTLSGAESFQYEGYFTLNLGGVSPDLTFTPVPEPSSYLICGLGGILMLALRFRPGRRNA